VKCEKEVFTEYAKAISAHLNADQQATDAPHAFRLAGTLNHKYQEPVIAKLVRNEVKEPIAIKKLLEKLGISSSLKNSTALRQDKHYRQDEPPRERMSRGR
jgi:hypothetical protein